MTQWKWQVAIIVPASSLAVAEEMTAAVAGAQQEATFVVGLSAAGVLPATHYACFTRSTDEWLMRMRDVLPSVPGAIFYRMDDSGVLFASTTNQNIGSPWTFAQSVADCGLAQVATT